MSEALKPCPFCGCEKIRFEKVYRSNRKWWLEITVKCANCLHGRFQKFIRFTEEEADKIMIDAWNLRVSAPQADQETGAGSEGV